MKPALIVIIGRKWFDKKAGNTYHDAEVIVHMEEEPGDNVRKVLDSHHKPNKFDQTPTYMDQYEKVRQHRTHMDYGYGEGYVQSAAAWLEEQGILKLERYSNGAVQPLWQYCSDNGIKLIRTEMNVISRKELKGG